MGFAGSSRRREKGALKRRQALADRSETSLASATSSCRFMMPSSSCEPERQDPISASLPEKPGLGMGPRRRSMRRHRSQSDVGQPSRRHITDLSGLSALILRLAEDPCINAERGAQVLAMPVISISPDVSVPIRALADRTGRRIFVVCGAVIHAFAPHRCPSFVVSLGCPGSFIEKLRIGPEDLVFDLDIAKQLGPQRFEALVAGTIALQECELPVIGVHRQRRRSISLVGQGVMASLRDLPPMTYGATCCKLLRSQRWTRDRFSVQRFFGLFGFWVEESFHRIMATARPSAPHEVATKGKPCEGSLAVSFREDATVACFSHVAQADML